VPHCRRVFDKEREVVPAQQRQDAAGVGPEQFAHVGVELVVNVGEDDVEVGPVDSHVVDLIEPSPLHALG
jgi:hypothetical protein